MVYITILLALLLALVCMRWLASRFASVWLHLVQRPAVLLLHGRSGDPGESATNVAMLLAPIALITLLIFYAATWGRPQFATISTLIAHSLGKQHEQQAAGATATAPVGTGSSTRDGTPALRNVSTWAGHPGPSGSGAAGGGISGGPLPGALWSPTREPASAPAQTSGCASRAACRAESHALEAWKLCGPLIERAAPPPHRWVRAAADMHFNAFSTDETGGSVITYHGDGMLTRTHNGLWRRRAYSCAFDAAGGRVLSVQLMPVTQRLGP